MSAICSGSDLRLRIRIGLIQIGILKTVVKSEIPYVCGLPWILSYTSLYFIIHSKTKHLSYC